MGIKDDIAALIERQYGEGKDGQKIGRRLIEAGLHMMWAEGDLDATARICPEDESGAFHISHFREADEPQSTFEKIGAVMGREPKPGERIVITIDTDGRGFTTEYQGIVPNTPESAQEGTVEADSGLPAPVEAEDPRLASLTALETAKMLLRDHDWPVPDDATGHAFEALGQLLDQVTVVTISDADVPMMVRARAAGARMHSQANTSGGREAYDHTAFVLDIIANDLEKGLHIGKEDWVKALGELVQLIGEGNVTAGWWSDANLDLRFCDYAPHVFAGKMMLVVSEMSEAMEGHRKSKPSKITMDDHLPERPMVEVEFADALIRIFDLAANYRLPGGTTLDVPGAVRDKLAYNAVRPDHKPTARAAEGGKTI